ncbi:hypothetical protein E2C01_036960 [Portunus trituberculatus]|uniref:Uncharacterized protein n=1 Tax=Portunus trituberculatus TaxID=210409 RepID=A0A5B7FCN4_PORTR|nr:hypothetical protein [Portunus trituberculatus]
MKVSVMVPLLLLILLLLVNTGYGAEYGFVNVFTSGWPVNQRVTINAAYSSSIYEAADGRWRAQVASGAGQVIEFVPRKGIKRPLPCVNPILLPPLTHFDEREGPLPATVSVPLVTEAIERESFASSVLLLSF